ncbi:MAG: GNAT family N-acetyltransferase [Candidatus Zixiibacteriota bacterium]
MLTEIFGDKVRLRPLADADLVTRARWTADDELAILIGVDIEKEPFISQEDELRGNREWLAQRRRAGDVVYAIEVEGRYIGDIDIIIIPQERKAELCLFIGDCSQWGKGYGTETVELVLDALFSGEPVDTIQVDVPATNDRAFRFWQKLGFKEYSTDEEGTRYLRRSKWD